MQNFRLSLLPRELLGIFVTATFNQSEHIKFIFSVYNQRLYLLKTLRQNGLCAKYVNLVFYAIVVSRVIHFVWRNGVVL